MADDGTVLYAPPARRRGRRVPVLKLCCYALIGVVALLVVWLSVVVVKGLLRFKQSLDFPNADLAITNDKVTWPRVRPLINATTPFQVRATVWLDVTQHVQQQQLALPLRDDGTPIPVVTYRTGDGNATRSEAILYSEVVANMTSWSKAQYRDIALRIPIDPLYTQDLGPSSLRLTTQVEVADADPFGEFVFATSVLPGTSALLPRSPKSSRAIHGLTDVMRPASTNNTALWHPLLRATTLNQALEHAGTSTSLLALVASTVFVNASTCPPKGGNVLTSLMIGDGMPPFLDGAVSNQRFTTHAQLDSQGRRLYTRGKRCQVLMPHVRAKASVFVVPFDKHLDFSRYLNRQSKAKAVPELRRCLAMAERAIDEDTRTSNVIEKCSSLISWGPLETLLVFDQPGSGAIVKADNLTQLDKSLRLYYAPALRQRSAAAGPHHHYTIPRIRPDTANLDKVVNRSNKKSGCQLPVLQPDPSLRFFDVSLQLRIGSAKGTRLLMSDSIFANVEQTSKEEVLDDDKDVRIQSTAAWDMTWETAGALANDRAHEHSKPWIRFVVYAMRMVFGFASQMLTMVYWYTRTTTAGLCMWAQWSMAASVALNLAMIVHRSSSFLSDAFSITTSTATSTFLMMALLRLEFFTPTHGTWRSTRLTRRRHDKAERQCRLSESKVFGWQWPLVTIVTIAVYEHFGRPQHRILRDGIGCYSQNDDELGTKTWQLYVDELSRALEKSALFGQLVFNFVSPALQAQRGRAGSYAGNFKIVQYMFTLLAYTQAIVGHVKRISGHVTRRAPFSMLHVEMLAMGTVEAYQAWTLPGIPQHEPDDDDD